MHNFNIKFILFPILGKYYVKVFVCVFEFTGDLLCFTECVIIYIYIYI